ncbi:nucleotidyltransferase domain-containing protein [Flagellatimonas centrodinii]|uniref:nucleotidyltransferase family protein n=1 Tax=Flagellatimonas centrodinii TaxID=2806210 RepID=UPI001FFC7EEC|nr:nucleotidyltransferase domain-containing protein [Flagellatimonas centrodinii]ULQ46626.1 nucleotidyltransferase domain-containing protein [Flagellatimonas centrodinii]
MKPSHALALHRDELRQLAVRHGFLRPRIFGSVLHGDDTDDSDLDLLVDPTPTTTFLNLAGLQLEAQALLGVRVDVLTPKALPRRTRAQIMSEAAAV